jgi:glycosyltransferase involved in cell wall biosynthesis
MASKKPIIISDFPVFIEVLEPNKDCLFFRHDDYLALAEAIRKLKENPDMAERLALNAYQKVQTLTWANRASGIMLFIENIVLV